MTTPAPPDAPASAPVDDAGLAADVADSTDRASPIGAIRLLIDEARASAAQEVALARTAAGIVGGELRDISMWWSIAIACASIAVLCLAIGLMIALATVTGEWVAALVVPGALLIVALLAALRARSGTRRVKAAIDTLKRS